MMPIKSRSKSSSIYYSLQTRLNEIKPQTTWKFFVSWKSSKIWWKAQRKNSFEKFYFPDFSFSFICFVKGEGFFSWERWYFSLLHHFRLKTRLLKSNILSLLFNDFYFPFIQFLWKKKMIGGFSSFVMQYIYYYFMLLESQENKLNIYFFVLQLDQS